MLIGRQPHCQITKQVCLDGGSLQLINERPDIFVAIARDC